MINDYSNMDVGTMTMIDVTLPMTLLTHSEKDLAERSANCVSAFSFSPLLSPCYILSPALFPLPRLFPVSAAAEFVPPSLRQKVRQV